MNTRRGIVHFMFHPVSAKRFAEPLVAAAIAGGMQAELWIEDLPGLDDFRDSIKVPVKICPSNLGFNPVRAVATFVALLKNLRARRPLVVQAHLFRGAFLPLLAARLTGVPVRIYHNHGASYLGYRGPLRAVLMLIEKANGLLATHVLTVNAALKPALQAVIPNRPITVFGPGSVCGLAADAYASSLDPQRKQSARRNLNLKDGDLVFLYVGRPHRHKGFFILLKAFMDAFARRPEIKLLICGCAADDVAAAEPNAPSNIRALGYQQDLRNVYDASDAILLPSLYEGLPYSLLEGAARGCALLASRIPGAGALIEENKNGFLVKPGDEHDLIKTLQLMEQNREQLAVMGKESYEKSLQFRSENIIGPYLTFLRGILTLP